MPRTNAAPLLVVPDDYIPYDARKMITKAPPPGMGIALTVGKPPKRRCNDCLKHRLADGWELPDRWGHWTFDGKFTLRHADPASLKDNLSVDLRECRTAAGVADWTIGLAAKAFSGQMIGSFVKAVHDIIPLRCGGYVGPDLRGRVIQQLGLT